MPEVAVCSTIVNRLVRARMPGGVGAGGENPPATRFDVSQMFSKKSLNVHDPS
jgi:hypothetical protein